MVEDNETIQQATSTAVEACFLESQRPPMPISHERKRHLTDQSSTTSAVLQLKRQKLATEEENKRASRLEKLRAYHADKMEAETQGERDA